MAFGCLFVSVHHISDHVGSPNDKRQHQSNGHDQTENPEESVSHQVEQDSWRIRVQCQSATQKGKFFLDPSGSGLIRGGVDPDENDLKETAELDRLAQEAVDKLLEHADAVQLFATKKLENGKGETYRHVLGVGNYFTRYGVVRAWLNEQEGFQARRHKDDDDDTED